MEKRLYLLFSVLLHFSTAIPGVNLTLQKGKNQQRWAKLFYTHAQLEQDPYTQEYLFDRAAQCINDSDESLDKVRIRFPKSAKRRMHYNEKFLKKINASEQHVALAQKAWVHTMVANRFAKQNNALSKLLQTSESPENTPRSRNIFLKKARNDGNIQNIKKQKELLLEKAQKHYYKAADLYLQAYDLAPKKRYRFQAQEILHTHIYAVELEQISYARVFTISDEKSGLLRKINSADLL